MQMDNYEMAKRLVEQFQVQGLKNVVDPHMHLSEHTLEIIKVNAMFAQVRATLAVADAILEISQS